MTPKEGKEGALELITNEIKARALDGKSKLVLIEGATRSGKTSLAKELESTSKDIIHIDVVEECKKNGWLAPDITPLLTKKEKTYVVDEAGCCQIPLFLSALKAHLNNGGTAVVMVQSKRDIDFSGEYCSDCWFTLTRESLSKHEEATHNE